MKNFQVAYVPIGVPTYHLESAQKEFDNSVELLKKLADNVVFPQEMLLTIDKLKAFLDTIDPDLVVLQNLTFANAAYATEVLARFNCPILLWTLREPVIDGGRLRLNSLTGAYSAANAIKNFRPDAQFEYIFGSPSEEKVCKKIGATIKAAQIILKLKSLKIAQIGHTPQGFGFGRALDLEMRTAFGVTLESIEARELIEKAKTFSDDDIKEYLKDANNRLCGLENTPEKNRMDFARLYRAYKEYVTENNIGAIASRCWPDFFTSFGTPVCSVLSILNDLGVASSCEADSYGSLSMYIAMQLTGQAAFFGDPVSMDEKENTITFWHCVMAACSLARKDTGAKVDVHCNRKIGPTLDFGCVSCDNATIFRIGKDCEGKFRLFIADGKILDKPKQFNGTSIVVQTENSAEKIVNESILEGWEPHFVVAYGNLSEELKILANMLKIQVSIW